MVRHPLATTPYFASGTGPQHGLGLATVGLVHHWIRANDPGEAESAR
jgi:hypothetical protein